MDYIKLQKSLRNKHLFTKGVKVDRVFKKVNDKARQQQCRPVLKIDNSIAGYQYLCE